MKVLWEMYNRAIDPVGRAFFFGPGSTTIVQAEPQEHYVWQNSSHSENRTCLDGNSLFGI